MARAFPAVLALTGCSNGADEPNAARAFEPPVVSIAAPSEGAVFHQGRDAIDLLGTVHDSFDAGIDLSVAIPHPSLPDTGPGMRDDGSANFVLADFRLDCTVR